MSMFISEAGRRILRTSNYGGDDYKVGDGSVLGQAAMDLMAGRADQS